MPNPWEDIDAVSRVIKYCPETGKFFRKWKRKGWVETGFPAGGGYIVIYMFGRNFSAARVAWFIMTGEWPEHEVDHRDLDVSNNRWKNLRHAKPSQNCANKARYRNNTSGFKGVSVFRQGDTVKFRARVGVRGKRISLGLFNSPEEAHAAYVAAADSHHKEFARFQ